MWLMYACPHLLNGRPYTCQSRMLDVRSSGTTFMANERTLSALGGASFIDLQKRSAEELNRAQVGWLRSMQPGLQERMAASPLQQ
jgi:hypothetical protein